MTYTIFNAIMKRCCFSSTSSCFLVDQAVSYKFFLPSCTVTNTIKNVGKDNHLVDNYANKFSTIPFYTDLSLLKSLVPWCLQIIAGDPETVSETWMSNVYSYGMVLWEMITGEEAYSTYSPVQAAVGIAACGLRPEIPRDCPPFLRSLMNRCWDNSPLKRPQFSEIISILQRQNFR